ncbi:MAG: asparaginase [Candidatus Marsarchaeota archaeon]|jgi:L-asparaginase|nr:asparaginase [Candidatus Marsarchaeota archaeon]
MQESKKIAIITTGGTISSVSTKDGIAPREGIIEEMLVKELGYSASGSGSGFTSKDGRVKIDVIKLFNKDSTDIVADDRVQIAKEAFRCSEKYDGVVITHGTDSLEKTAYDLSLWFQYPIKPIIITGSFKTIEDTKSDAYENLRDSIAFACEGVCGIFVVFHGKALEGSFVYEHIVPYLNDTKNHQTFRSLRSEVATISENGISYSKGRDPIWKFQEFPQILEIRHSTGIVEIGHQLTPDRLESIAESAKGIIITATASGGVPQNLLPVLGPIARRKPVLSSPNYYLMQDNIFHKYATANYLREMGIIPGTPLQKFDREALAFILGRCVGVPEPSHVGDMFNSIIGEKIRQKELYHLLREKEGEPLILTKEFGRAITENIKANKPINGKPINGNASRQKA